jgi:hypothetical protein
MSEVKEYVGAEAMLLAKVLKLESIAIPFAGRNPMWLGLWMKTLGKTVHMNDLLQFSYMDAVGMIENEGFLLDGDTLGELVKDIGQPEQPGIPALVNPELARLVSSNDASFFDQLRPRIENLPARQKGIAIRAGYSTIRYAQVMDASRFVNLRVPLEKIFAREVEELNKRITSSGKGQAHNEEAGSFVGNVRANALYMQLPQMAGISGEYASGARPRGPLGREIWARGPSKTWLPALKAATKGTFGDQYTSREAYFKMVTEFLEKANDYPVWVFNLSESEYPDVLRAVMQFRKPKAVHRFDTREASGGYMSYFLIAEK